MSQPNIRPCQTEGMILLNKELIVRGAPQEYLCQVGAWDTLPTHLERRGLKNVLVVRGNASWEVAKRNSLFYQLLHLLLKYIMVVLPTRSAIVL